MPFFGLTKVIGLDQITADRDYNSFLLLSLYFFFLSFPSFSVCSIFDKRKKKLIVSLTVLVPSSSYPHAKHSSYPRSFEVSLTFREQQVNGCRLI